MEITEQMARVAHIFTRFEEIKQQYRWLPGRGQCPACTANGGLSLADFIGERERRREELQALKKEEEELIKTLRERVGENKEVENSIRACYAGKESSIEAQELCYELEGFWAALFQMIQDEGLDPKSFMDFCTAEYRRHGGNCAEARYRIETWLYKATMGEYPKEVWYDPGCY